MSFVGPGTLHRDSDSVSFSFLQSTDNQWALHELTDEGVPHWSQFDKQSIWGYRETFMRGTLWFRKKMHGRYIQLFRAYKYTYIYLQSAAVMLGYKGTFFNKPMHTRAVFFIS